MTQFNYQSNTISGLVTTHRRHYKILLNNPYQGLPDALISEEEIITLPDNSFIKNHKETLHYVMQDINARFPLVDANNDPLPIYDANNELIVGNSFTALDYYNMNKAFCLWLSRERDSGIKY